jgi:glycosyltransferase involved in cell wall biosynthesis
MIARRKRLNVAVVAPVMARYDAISLSARDTVRALAVDPRFEVQYCGTVCDFEGVAHRYCGDSSQLLLDPFYQGADAAIFHFGIYHDLFHALMAGGPRIRIVRFHNVTPARFVSAADVPLIEKSLRQIAILRVADEIWADSSVNAQELLDRGFDRDRLRIMPLVVEDPEMNDLAAKKQVPIEALYIGRIVPSKGLHDLISAIAKTGLRQCGFRVTIAGNTAWSDDNYIKRLRDLIRKLNVSDMVRFVGTISDLERERLLHGAHIVAIPSYHEGFCRPVVEGLRAGCVPVVYDGYNLPHIVAGLGRVVPTGDIIGLAAAMVELVRAFPLALEMPTARVLPLDRGLTSALEFSELANQHLASFTPEAVNSNIRNRLLELAQGTT